MTTPIHVVSKVNNAEHAVCRINENCQALAASSVRAQTYLISLTSNNLTYARFGWPLGWWDVFHVPDSAPEPFNNNLDWGIVPAWGYGRVIESTIDDIATGSLLWGMWPTSAHAVDLQLKATEPAGHWKECGQRRDQLMTIYNNYQQLDRFDPLDMRVTALCKPLWIGPSLLNSSVFSSRRIHPFGQGDPWSEDDADLSQAVVISLSASSKTGRSFWWELAHNRDLKRHGPLALVQFTSAPTTLPKYSTSLPTKAVSYEDLHSALWFTWVSHFRPSRIVIIDFGASDSVLSSLISSTSKISKATTVISVGYEAKVYSVGELVDRLATNKSKVMVNTSGMQDQTIKAMGQVEYFGHVDTAWKRCLEEKAFDDLQVKVVKAGEGHEGIEGAWADLCDRKVPTNMGIVIEFAKD